MAYSTTNPPRVLIPGMGGSRTVWEYSSTHGSTELLATGFFTNGQHLGMRVGDVVVSSLNSSGVLCISSVTIVAASSGVTVGNQITSS